MSILIGAEFISRPQTAARTDASVGTATGVGTAPFCQLRGSAQRCRDHHHHRNRCRESAVLRLARQGACSDTAADPHGSCGTQCRHCLARTSTTKSSNSPASSTGIIFAAANFPVCLCFTLWTMPNVPSPRSPTICHSVPGSVPCSMFLSSYTGGRRQAPPSGWRVSRGIGCKHRAGRMHRGTKNGREVGSPGAASRNQEEQRHRRVRWGAGSKYHPGRDGTGRHNPGKVGRPTASRVERP